MRSPANISKAIRSVSHLLKPDAPADATYQLRLAASRILRDARYGGREKGRKIRLALYAEIMLH